MASMLGTLGDCKATNPVKCDQDATGTWASTPVCDDHFYYALAVMNAANRTKEQ